MGFQEEFFKEQLKVLQEARDAKEDNFERLQQEQLKRAEQSYAVEDPSKREEKLESFIKSQSREMKEFEEEREKMMKVHEEKKAEMKRRHWKEEVELEEQLDAELEKLMNKYTPQS